MAHFVYNGEILASLISQGPCTQIRVPKQDGTKMVINASDMTSGFVIGQDIGVDITDARALRVMRADSRFTEVV